MPLQPIILTCLVLVTARAAARSLSLLRLLLAHLGHLVHAHVILVILCDLLRVRGELGLPLGAALLGFVQAVLLVVLDFGVAVGGALVAVWDGLVKRCECGGVVLRASVV